MALAAAESLQEQVGAAGSEAGEVMMQDAGASSAAGAAADVARIQARTKAAVAQQSQALTAVRTRGSASLGTKKKTSASSTSPQK